MPKQTPLAFADARLRMLVHATPLDRGGWTNSPNGWWVLGRSRSRSAARAVAGEERRFVIHGVSRLVAIGRDLDEQMWTSGLRGCAASED